MEVSSTHQVFVFAVCVLTGVGSGLFFDVQRSLRKISSAGKLRTTAEDILFVTLFSATAIVMGFIFNRGQMRYYQIMGILSGALFYAAFLSRIAMRFMECVCKTFVKIILRPVLKLIMTLIHPIKVFFEFCRRKTAEFKSFVTVRKRLYGSKIKKIKKRMKML